MQLLIIVNYSYNWVSEIICLQKLILLKLNVRPP